MTSAIPRAKQSDALNFSPPDSVFTSRVWPVYASYTETAIQKALWRAFDKDFYTKCDR